MKILSLKKALVAFSAACILTSCGPSKKQVAQKQEKINNEIAEIKNYSKVEQQLLETSSGTVYFAFDKSHLSKSAKDSLDVQVSILKNFPDVKVQIEGHTDSKGTVEYNIGLGERRAEAVKCYLVSHGIEESRISIVSFGKSRLIPATSDQELKSKSYHAKNRRAVTIVLSEIVQNDVKDIEENIIIKRD